MTLPSMRVLPPPRMAGMTNSPVAGIPTRMQPAMIPVRGERDDDVPHQARPVRTEVSRRLEHRRIATLKRDVYRQDHQREVGEDDAHPDGERRVEHVERAVDQAETMQHGLERPSVLQDVHPRVRPDQEARPERHDHREQQEHLKPRPLFDDEEGKRERNHDADDGGSRRQTSDRTIASRYTACRRLA